MAAQSKNPKAKPSATRMYALSAPSNLASTAESPAPPLFTLNAIPARILHNGAMQIAPRHWDPQSTSIVQDQSQEQTQVTEPAVHTAYFRGRKLLGTPVSLPPTHTAALLRVTDKTRRDTSLRDEAMRELEHRRAQLDGTEYEEELEELRAADARGELSDDIGVMEKVGDIGGDGVWLWGHETVPGQAGEVADVAGLEGGRLGEWIALAGAMHAY